MLHIHRFVHNKHTVLTDVPFKKTASILLMNRRQGAVETFCWPLQPGCSPAVSVCDSCALGKLQVVSVIRNARPIRLFGCHR